ncbi:hypothetical protein BDD12DRAFT_341337 [Trichophaea hybrida]|nr:hypothetical protein BDD12DRAFT_341337 [Trichophaea hybrida]
MRVLNKRKISGFNRRRSGDEQGAHAKMERRREDDVEGQARAQPVTFRWAGRHAHNYLSTRCHKIMCIISAAPIKPIVSPIEYCIYISPQFNRISYIAPRLFVQPLLLDHCPAFKASHLPLRPLVLFSATALVKVDIYNYLQISRLLRALTGPVFAKGGFSRADLAVDLTA